MVHRQPTTPSEAARVERTLPKISIGKLVGQVNNLSYPFIVSGRRPLARGMCDGLTIPSNALGVVGNATVVSPVGAGYLTLWPGTATQPTTATLNYNGGQIVNPHFIVGLGSSDGSFKMLSLATTDLVIDLSGYFAP
jgi:hypothetical protein